MKLKNELLFGGTEAEIYSGLAGFMNQPIPIALRIKLKPILSAIEKQCAEVFEQRDFLIKKHNPPKDEKQKSFSISSADSGWEEFNKEFAILSDTEFDIPIEKKIKCPAKVIYNGRVVDLIIIGKIEELLFSCVEFEDA